MLSMSYSVSFLSLFKPISACSGDRLMFAKCLLGAFIKHETPGLVPPGSRVFDYLPWWAKVVLNHRPPACKAGALPLSYSPLE